jgi:hypothetical protein
MQIDQRNATTTALGYTLDRFYLFRSSNHDQHAFSVVQDTDAPDGFSNSLKYTTTTAETTVDADELLYLRQRIEAQNLQHLAYGASSAKSVTLSFWVKSSVTGTFAVSLFQSDAGKQLSKTYTINSANTWEKKTITYIGNTSDVINNDNGNGLQINWILGAGSDYTSTDSSSAWLTYGTGSKFAYGHATNAVATTLNATWYITGVQLEVGESATEFEHRPYTTELQLCQRYLPWFGSGTDDQIGIGYATGSTSWLIFIPWKVQTRVAPTGIIHGTDSNFHVGGPTSSGITCTALNFSAAGTSGGRVTGSVSSGLSSGQGTFLRSQNTGGYLYFTGCEL